MNSIDLNPSTNAAPGAAVLALVLASVTLGSGNLFAQQAFHDWTAQTSGLTTTFTNSSYAGQIIGTGTSVGAPTGTYGVPSAITKNNTFTTEFNISAVGKPITFNFSSGYFWGSGGQLILGNIHNYFEYTLSAWDFNNTPIDVNQWPLIAEYPSSATGTSGYFSTSKTNRAVSGNSSKFSVFDPSVSPNSAQGGVLWLYGLKNVAKLQLTLSNNNLSPNGQGSDLVLFNVSTPNRMTTQLPCQPATDYNDKPVPAGFDGANCYIKPVVASTTAFIWNNNYYVTADKSTSCAQGTGYYDGANCYFMPKPAGGFVLNDKLYVPLSVGNCSAGAFDGTACLVKVAPWGTHAFEWQNGWYFTPLYTCKDGSYDGANCYIMTPPSGGIAFIWNNAFYYGQ